ncbi:MAG: hypothetical protein E6K81_11505 [Candidatus Eisenbacteria bacterium]|uniref:Uncharacterized protein n=1 Tax=Eiseniibacteriota bacterium TaxID=2212470 RepID=A0A538U5D6_UNCEI|nr:MAG: hypothetical protein E6K81_11505 [Candidatus Eisenbacteria bacterium]
MWMALGPLVASLVAGDLSAGGASADSGMPVVRVDKFAETKVSLLPWSRRAGEPRTFEDGSVAFAFLGDRGDVYIYDLVANRLNVLSSTSATTSRWRSTPGPALQAENDQPHDGCVGRDGTIYLLNDRTSTTERFWLYYRRLIKGPWLRAGPFDDERIGRVTLDGVQRQRAQSARIATNEKGEVELFDLDRRRSSAIVIADSDGVRPSAARAVGAPAALSASGRIAESSDPESGRFLGVDAAGSRYFMTTRGELYFLERYDSKGELTASVRYRNRSIAGLMVGKGNLLVDRSGGVYEICATGQGFLVSRWSTGR